MYVTKKILAALSIITTTTVMAGPSSEAATGSRIAPLGSALTLAQISSNNGTDLDTLLVLEEQGDSIAAVNLSNHFGHTPKDPLDFLASVGRTDILRVVDSVPSSNYRRADLRITPVLGRKHIAAGTNYLAHQEEAGIHSGFLFPKISKATSFVSQVKTSPSVLMDYEVELCFRFQEDVDSIAKFKTSIKGFFLCGDMSDRAELLRKVNVDDLASGIGFTDAKSGSDRFPVGPYTVVPVDWEQFVNSVNIHTSVNGEVRQRSSTSKMIKKADGLVADILEKGQDRVWVYEGAALPLIENGYIGKGTAILTGTPEGVVYNGISTWSKIVWGSQWALSFSFLETSAVNYVIEKTIQEGFSSNHYLQPGDQVTLGGTYLGRIDLTITE